ncbi:MAG: prolyl oligopeptidase family serine peptidase [Candidatus Eisenbacteria bacterium]
MLRALAVATLLASALPAFAAVAAGAPSATASASTTATLAAASKPPETRMQLVRDTLHGTPIEDPYRWLEDASSPETRAWIGHQDAYRRGIMTAAPGRERIHARLEQLHRTNDASLPVERAGRLFFLKRAADQELFVLTMRASEDAKDQVLFDPHTMSSDRHIALRILDVADNANLVALGIQRGGEDEVTVSFLDVATRKFRRDALPRARYSSVQFSGDAKSVYYSRHGKDGPRVMRHVLGRETAADTPVFGAGLGPDKIVSLSVSDNGAWLLISVRHGSAGDQVELHAKDLRLDHPVKAIVTDLRARFDGKFGGDTLFIRTNWNAPNHRIMAIDLTRPARENWREVLREGANAIDGWALAGGRLLINYVVNVSAQLYLVATDGRVLGPVAVGDLGAVRGLSGRWSGPHAYLSFESFNAPPRILRIAAATNDAKTWWASNAPFRGQDYEVVQAWFASKDGTRVPMFLAHRKGVANDGTAPVYLTGYGGFAQNRTPRYSAVAALWMENGGIWAEPALRGGGEFGEDWHRGGMLAKKQNSFDDFIAAAEWLVSRRFTSKDRLAIAGGSNGGLLVGAALTQRPDLFRAVVCSVPLLDMVRYHRFQVGPFWVPEYGSSDDAEQFRTLHAYSPYHRVRIGEAYPAVMLVSGDSDTRVDPLHARKMTALLQSATRSHRPVLLRYDSRSGHSGGKPRSRQIEDDTETMQFLFWQLGIEPREGAPPPLPAERPTGDRQP